MPDIGWVFLYTPVPYLGAMYFVAYRHDLARFVKPFHDVRPSRANWFAVCKTLGLVGDDLKPPRFKEVPLPMWVRQALHPSQALPVRGAAPWSRAEDRGVCLCRA